MTFKTNFGLALALVTGLVLGEESPVDMRVEEPAPSGQALPPINPAQESDRWSGQAASEAPLSPSEKASLQDRRKQMEAMLVSIRKKREALQKANGGDRDLLVQELQSLVLDGNPVTAGSGKQLDKAEKQLRKSEHAREKEARKALKIPKDKSSQGGNPKD